jgi:hypothetical protein
MKNKTNKTDGTTATPSEKKKTVKSRFKNKKTVIFSVTGLFIVLGALLTAGFAYAASTDKNIPVFSEGVELAETAVWNNREQLKDTPLGDTSLVPDEAESIPDFFRINEKLQDESYKYNMEMDLNMSIESDEVIISNLDGTSLTMEYNGTYIPDEIGITEAEVGLEIVTEGLKMYGDGEMILKNSEDIYFKVDTLPSSSALEAEDGFKTGEWYYMDMEKMEEVTGTSQLDTDELFEMQEELMKRLEEELDNEAFVENIEKKEDKVIDGVRNHCFTNTLEEEELVDAGETFLKVYVDVLHEHYSDDLEMMSYEELQESMNEAFEYLDYEVNDLVVNYCVSRKTEMLYEYNMEGGVKVIVDESAMFHPSFDGVDIEQEVEPKLHELYLDFKINTSYSGYGEDYEIDYPDDPVDLYEEYIKPAMEEAEKHQQEYEEQMKEFERINKQMEEMETYDYYEPAEPYDPYK